jgi:deoxyribonuclease V
VAAGGQDEAAGVFAAVDVCYLGADGARAALVAAADPRFAALEWTVTAITPQMAAVYQPGQFWRRELPPLRAVCADVPGLGLIVIDGYVDLDPGGRPGLGARVHAEFGVPVIGVAKTFFRGASHAAQIRRGRSARPLYVTAAGISVPDAARLVADMAGTSRIPDALRLADRLARGLERPARPASGLEQETQVTERPPSLDNAESEDEMAEMQVQQAAADEVDDPGDQDEEQDGGEHPEQGPQPAGQVREHSRQLPSGGRGMRARARDARGALAARKIIAD